MGGVKVNRTLLTIRGLGNKWETVRTGTWMTYMETERGGERQTDGD